MKITINEDNVLQLEEVYNGIVLKTNSGEELAICMRDTGFEFTYDNNRYFTKNGLVAPLGTMCVALPIKVDIKKINKMDEIEKLEQEIELKKQALANLQKEKEGKLRNEAIKPLVLFTDKEKIAEFDSLYFYVLSIVEDKEKDGYVDDDVPHHAYETLMKIITSNPEKFWKYYNSLSK